MACLFTVVLLQLYYVSLLIYFYNLIYDNLSLEIIFILCF